MRRLWLPVPFALAAARREHRPCERRVPVRERSTRPDRRDWGRCTLTGAIS